MTTKQFIGTINHKKTDCIIRAIPERKGLVGKVQTFRFKFEDYDKFEPRLHQLNDQGYGIFYVINGGEKDSDVTEINAIFVESDSLSIEQQLENLSKFPVRPSIVNRTRKSIHAFWIVKDLEVKEFRSFQGGLVQRFDGDAACVNESRLMRLPYFYHQKQGPFWVETIEYNPDAVYSKEDFLPYLPEPEPEKSGCVVPVWTSPKREYQKGSAQDLEKLIESCDFICWAKEHPEQVSEPLWRAALSIIDCFEGGEDKALEISQGHPKFSPMDTMRKLEQIRQSAAGPYRCDTIQSHGFQCEKMKHGGCGCKSPAALPLALEDKYWEKAKEPWYFFDEDKKPVLNKDALIKELAPFLPSIYYADSWHMYQGGVYKPVKEDYVKDIIRGMLREGCRSTKDINEVYELWRLQISRDNDSQLDSNPNLINVLNGLYDYEKGILLPHTDEYRSVIQLNAEYKSYAGCPGFLKFLSEALHPDDIPVLQEYMGYCMTKYTCGERCMILFGVSRSGKSTLLDIISDTIGPENVTHIKLQNLEDRFKTARLEGKLVNTFSELPNSSMGDTGILKALISGEPIVVENKGKTPYDMRPFAKLLFSANELPKNNERSNAFAKRLLLVRFDRSVPDHLIDVNLKAKLLREKSGIFNWAVEGLKRLKANQFQFSESQSGKEAIIQYRQDSDNALRFLSECAVENSEHHCYCEDLYFSYKEWCVNSGYTHSQVSKPRFNDTVLRMFGDKVHKALQSDSRRAIWKGISFKAPEAPLSVDELVSQPLSDTDVDDLKNW